MNDPRTDEERYGLNNLQMFRLKNPYYRSYEQLKKECKAKRKSTFNGPPEENYPVHPEWAGRGDYTEFHFHILRMLNVSVEIAEREGYPPYNVKFIEPKRGLVPGNLRLELKAGRIDSVRRLVDDAQQQAKTNPPDPPPPPKPRIDPSMLSGTLITNNTTRVIPRPRFRRFSENFCDKDGKINPSHTPRDADECSVREYHLSRRSNAAAQGIDRSIEQEHCRIINDEYGTDNLDVLDRIFSVFGRIDEDTESDNNVAPETDFTDMIQQIIAKQSKDPEVRKRAWEEVYNSCSIPECYNLETENGLCIRHVAVKRLEDKKQDQIEKQTQESKDGSPKPKPFKQTRFLLPPSLNGDRINSGSGMWNTRRKKLPKDILTNDPVKIEEPKNDTDNDDPI